MLISMKPAARVDTQEVKCYFDCASVRVKASAWYNKLFLVVLKIVGVEVAISA